MRDCYRLWYHIIFNLKVVMPRTKARHTIQDQAKAVTWKQRRAIKTLR